MSPSQKLKGAGVFSRTLRKNTYRVCCSAAKSTSHHVFLKQKKIAYEKGS